MALGPSKQERSAARRQAQVAQIEALIDARLESDESETITKISVQLTDLPDPEVRDEVIRLYRVSGWGEVRFPSEQPVVELQY
jgi:hypothetical protein